MYVTFQNTSGNYWNGSTFEAYTSGNWTTYDVAATNEGAGVYSVSVPTDATDYQLRLQAGGSPATTDAIVDAGPIPVDAADLDTQLDAILAASGSGNDTIQIDGDSVEIN